MFLSFILAATFKNSLRLFILGVFVNKMFKTFYIYSFVTTVFLLLLTGVHSVLVALMAAKAEVEFDPARVLPSQIANSITELGFPSTIIEEESGAGKVELEVKFRHY